MAATMPLTAEAMPIASEAMEDADAAVRSAALKLMKSLEDAAIEDF